MDIYISESDFRKRYEYEPSNLLGEGGFAQVYKAFDRQFQEYVALKFYNKGEQGKYDVLHEMKDSRSFSHKNIIRVHDAFVVRFEQAGTYSYIQVGVLELANGGNLRDFINTGPSASKIFEVLTGILEGLKYLHSEKKIIHRDLSPENILMFVEGDKLTPKITDFGISKKLTYDSLTREQEKSTQLVGKVEYMAPEQFSPEKFGIGGKINTNIDLWAFGIILYEIFMNKTPFGSKAKDNPLTGIHSIVNDPVQDIEGIPYPYKKVVERCLVKNAGKRVQDAEELITLLKSISYRQHKTRTTKTIPVIEFKNRYKYFKWIGISFIMIIVSISGYFAFVSLFKPSASKAMLKTESLIKERKFADAVLFIENLPQNIKSDSLIKDLYYVSTVSVARDELISIIEDSDYQGGRNYFEGLKDTVKKNPEIMALYDKLINLSVIDSLIEKGDSYFKENKYSEAGICYNTVLDSYDTNNHYADSMVLVINSLLSSAEKVMKGTTASRKLLTDFSGRNLKVDIPPDPKQIKLLSIKFSANETKITLQIQPSDNPVTIYSPLEDNAFYIEYNNGNQQLPLLDVQGIVTNEERIYTVPTDVNLIFGRLPENVNIFNLMEGKNQQDDLSQHYFNFKGIRLIKD